MNTRVAELCGLRQFRLVEADLADPGPGEVQVRIDAVGICGSDLHSYAEGGVGDTPCQYPMVLGHEPAGMVARVGAGVTGWNAGDRAAFEPAIYCYHCEFCRTGHHNVCANLRFMSMPGDPGFFREYANIPAHNLIAIPPAPERARRDHHRAARGGFALHAVCGAAAVGNRGGIRRGANRADDHNLLEAGRRRAGSGRSSRSPRAASWRGRPALTPCWTPRPSTPPGRSCAIRAAVAWT